MLVIFQRQILSHRTHTHTPACKYRHKEPSFWLWLILIHLTKDSTHPRLINKPWTLSNIPLPILAIQQWTVHTHLNKDPVSNIFLCYLESTGHKHGHRRPCPFSELEAFSCLPVFSLVCLCLLVITHISTLTLIPAHPFGRLFWNRVCPACMLLF